MQQRGLGRRLCEYFVTCLSPRLRHRACVRAHMHLVRVRGGGGGGETACAFAVLGASAVCILLCFEFLKTKLTGCLCSFLFLVLHAGLGGTNRRTVFRSLREFFTCDKLLILFFVGEEFA